MTLRPIYASNGEWVALYNGSHLYDTLGEWIGFFDAPNLIVLCAAKCLLGWGMYDAGAGGPSVMRAAHARGVGGWREAAAVRRPDVHDLASQHHGLPAQHRDGRREHAVGIDQGGSRQAEQQDCRHESPPEHWSPPVAEV